MNKEVSLLHGSEHIFVVTKAEQGMRLDAFLSLKFPDYSRSFLQKIIKQDLVNINTIKTKKNSFCLKQNDIISLIIPEKKEPVIFAKEDLSHLQVKIIFQNSDFAIIAKPAGLIVHANHAKMTEPTLVTWLTHAFNDIAQVGYQDRPGIVHRLDKNTSGLMIIPLTNPAFAIFSKLFKDRKIQKTYTAIVKGHPQNTGVFSGSIARHPTIRNKMTIDHNGRNALTHYKVLEHFSKESLVTVQPVTGRTHQIRVHFAAAGHSLIGDEVYGSRSHLIQRHALHAQKIAFIYKDQAYEFETNMPDDFNDCIARLKKD